MKDKVILILDKEEYKAKKQEHLAILKTVYQNAEIFYTEYEDDRIRKVRVIKYIGSALQHILYWHKSYQYAKKIYREADGSDIICINPIVGSFLGSMNRKKKCKICLCGFLFEPKKNKLYYELRKAFVRKSLKNIDTTVVYAEKEIRYYQKLFPDLHFVFVPYGIDYQENQTYQRKLPEEYIFSGGGSNRDYKTLFEAYHKLREKRNIPLVVATLPRCVEGLDCHDIDIRNDVVVETFGDVMKKAKLLVLSLKDFELSVGHMVILQALKNHVPIMVNQVEAVQDYVSEKDVIFYKSGNADDLAEKLEQYLSGILPAPDTSALYEEKFTFNCLLKRLVELQKD